MDRMFAVTALPFLALVTITNAEQFQIRRKLRDHHQRLSELTDPSFPAPAPAPQSMLATTTLPITETTIFSPEARLGTAWEDYQNEMDYGRPNINATATADIVAPTSPPLVDVDLATPQEVAAASAAAAAEAAIPTTTLMVQPAVDPTETDEVFRTESALDCLVGDWTEWGGCSSDGGGDGLRGWHEVKYRPVINPHVLGGLVCLPRVERRPCPVNGWSDAQQQWQYAYQSGGMDGGLPGGAMTPADIKSAATACACNDKGSTVALLETDDSRNNRHEYVKSILSSRLRTRHHSAEGDKIVENAHGCMCREAKTAANAASKK